MNHTPTDTYDLQRFLDAQSEGVHERALAEFRSGRKRSHWMWFVFPQIAGLGSSAMAQHYAIRNEAEARAYLAHPVLGPRLTECAQALLALDDRRSASEIMGYPDDLKLRSSATLFHAVSPAGSVFEKLLAKYFGGHPDERTLEFLGRTVSNGDGGAG